MTESTDLAHRTATGSAIASTSPLGEVGAMLDAFMAMAKDPNVDAAKFETIARVAKETREDAKKEQFYTAKAAAMLEMPVIDKRGKITIEKNGQTRVQGTFAKWPDLQRAITPVLAKHGLALTHKIDQREGDMICLVTPVLMHRNGYVEEGGQMALPLDTSGGKNNTQGAGSAASYGKRHTTIAHLGIRLDDSDDDGWLTATEDEPLNDQQTRRVAEAQTNWDRGQEAFETWFSKLEPKDRAWLINTGRYAQITGSDAGRLIARSVGADPDEKPKPRPAAPPVTNGNGRDVTTPEGWTDQYVEDCGKADSLDALARVQAKGAKGLQRLKEGGKAQLHEKAVKAGSDAYGRLSGIDQPNADDDVFPGDR